VAHEVGAVTAAAGDAPGSTLPVPAELFAGARILIVDDRDSNVLLLETILRAEGVAHIASLTDSRLTVDRCLEFRPDVLLLDLHMPHLDGFGVLRELKRRLAPDVFLPVVVLTADATSDARLRVLEAGAKDFLTKPIDRLEVVLRVRNLLETGALYAVARRRRERVQHELDARLAEDHRRAEHARQRTELFEQVLEGDDLTTVYQPIVELATGAVTGVEALSRFAHEPIRSPDKWFAEAKTLGLAERFELAAVERALAVVEHMPGEWFVSVNVSPDTAITEELGALLATVSGERVVLELTEHDEIPDYESLRSALDHHRARGVRVAVDDAGAGYAGLQHILSLAPEILKLDLQLIRGIDQDIARRALARCLVDFAGEIGAAVLAEGVSSLAELDVLRAVGVPLGQGYYLGRPAADLPACIALTERSIGP
jgi:EAL domain-containing protein (putative c-di-GMP-specific phosphodiesterase class I)